MDSMGQRAIRGVGLGFGISAAVLAVGCSESEVDILAFEQLTAVAATIAPEDRRCAFGGAIIQTGIDDNRNGTLDTEEVDDARVSCNNSLPTGASPLISSFVAGNAMPAAGETVSLTVTATDSSGGSALTYSWFDVTGQLLLTETGATLTVVIPTDAEPGDTLVYQVTVTDSAQVEQIRRMTLVVSEPTVRPVTAVTTEAHQIFLPDGLEAPVDQPTGDFDGVVFFAGTNSLPDAQKMRSPRDLGGFAAQRRNFGRGSNARSELDQLRNLVSAQPGFALTNISTAVTRACAVGRFALDLADAATPTALTRVNPQPTNSVCRCASTRRTMSWCWFPR